MTEDEEDRLPYTLQNLSQRPKLSTEQRHGIFDKLLKFKYLTRDTKENIALNGNHDHRTQLLKKDAEHRKNNYPDGRNYLTNDVKAIIAEHGNESHRDTLVNHLINDHKKLTEYNVDLAETLLRHGTERQRKTLSKHFGFPLDNE